MSSCTAEYYREYRKRRLAEGRPIPHAPRMLREDERKWEAIYYARPAVKAKRAAQMRAYTKNPALRLKHEARWKTQRAIASGRLIKQPCFCGNQKAQAHHGDYSKPLDVRWLCLKHHIEWHTSHKALP